MRLILMTILRDKSYDCFEYHAFLIICNTKTICPMAMHQYTLCTTYCSTKSIEEFSTNAFLCPKATKSLLYEYVLRQCGAKHIQQEQQKIFINFGNKKVDELAPFVLVEKFLFRIQTHTCSLLWRIFLVNPAACRYKRLPHLFSQWPYVHNYNIECTLKFL